MSTAEQIRDGITIMMSYGSVDICAEHDIIYAGPPGNVSREDYLKLEALSWHVPDVGGWAHFV